MAFVQLLPIRGPMREVGVQVRDVQTFPSVPTQPRARLTAPSNLAKHEVGPIVIEQRASGDLLIYTRTTQPVTARVNECEVTIKKEIASETNRILIQNADVQDLIVALDAVLNNRPTRT